MRKVTEQTCAAFLDRERKISGNTTSTGDDLLLHGNCIAWHHDTHTVKLRMCGWGSVTTRERLNGLLELLRQRNPKLPWLRFCQCKGSQMLSYRSSLGSVTSDDDFDSHYSTLTVCYKPGEESVTYGYELLTVRTERRLLCTETKREISDGLGGSLTLTVIDHTTQTN